MLVQPFPGARSYCWPVIRLSSTKTCFCNHACTQDRKMYLLPVLVLVGTRSYVGFSFHYYFVLLLLILCSALIFLNLYYTCILLPILLHLTFLLLWLILCSEGFLELMLSIGKFIFFRVQSVLWCVYIILNPMIIFRLIFFLYNNVIFPDLRYSITLYDRIV